MRGWLKGLLTVVLWTAAPPAVAAAVLGATGHLSGHGWVLVVAALFGLAYGLEAGILTSYDLGSPVGWLELLVDMTWSLPNTVWGFVLGNLIFWFQNDHIQARVAYNYRSRRAVSEDVGSIAGMELYEAPQKYVDASLSYKINKYVEVFLQGTNLSNEYQRFYLVWPDQPAHSNFSERPYMLGIRGQW